MNIWLHHPKFGRVYGDFLATTIFWNPKDFSLIRLNHLPTNRQFQKAAHFSDIAETIYLRTGNYRKSRKTLPLPPVQQNYPLISSWISPFWWHQSVDIKQRQIDKTTRSQRFANALLMYSATLLIRIYVLVTINKWCIEDCGITPANNKQQPTGSSQKKQFLICCCCRYVWTSYSLSLFL